MGCVLSNEILMKWKQLEEEVVVLSTICISHWIRYTEGYNIELPGFCDGAEAADATEHVI